MKWVRKLAWAVVAAAIVAAILWGFREQPLLVDVATAERGPMRITVDEEGKTRVIDRYVVSAPIAGYSRRIQMDVGDSVTKGKVLLRLDPLRSRVLDPRSRAEAKARVSGARASLSAARENTTAAEADASYWTGQLARARELRVAATIAEQDFQQTESRWRRAEATLRSAKFSVEVARYEVEAARTALRHSAAQGTGQPAETVAIRAPVSGRILKIIHKSEGVVQPGEALLEIGDPRGLEVEVEALSADAVKIVPGVKTLLERWGGDEPLEARVRSVEPVGFTKISALGVEEQRVLVIASIVSPPEKWQRLGDGYRVEARFVLWEEDDILRIPASSLFRYGSGWAAFVVEDGIARRREVQLGRRNGLAAQVLAGIEEGEIVVTHPDDAIDDGVKVRPLD